VIGQKSTSIKFAAAPRRLGIKGARTFAASLAVLSLGGCATWSPDGGFGAVQLVAGQELQKETTRIRTPEEAAAARDRVQALLAKPLNPESAVQIALLNNRGLQAAYSELGIAEATMVESSLPPSPIFSVGRLASSGGVVAEVERMIVVNILALATLPQRSAIARERFRQAQLEAALATLRTAGNARRDFYRAAAAHQTVHLLERAQGSASAGAELLAELGRTGAAPKIDQAREQAFYAEITAQLAQAKLRHTQATEALIRTLGLWGADLERMKETGALPPLPARPLAQADAEAEALRRRMDLQVARMELAVLGQSLGLEQATRFVDLLELSGISAREREEVIEHGERRSSGQT
jgi:outer membrane protein TolC